MESTFNGLCPHISFTECRYSLWYRFPQYLRSPLTNGIRTACNRAARWRDNVLTRHHPADGTKSRRLPLQSGISCTFQPLVVPSVSTHGYKLVLSSLHSLTPRNPV